MTEYKAECRIDSGDYVVADIHNDNDDVRLRAYDDNDPVTDVILAPAAARAFARGVLALADVCDGGEPKPGPEPAPEPLKVGDRVVATAVDRGADTQYIGKTGTLVRIDDDSLPYRVHLPDLGFDWWFTGVRKVEAAADPKPAEERLPKVGDLLRVLQDGASAAEVQRGDVLKVVCLYGGMVQAEAGDGRRWYFNLHRIGTDVEIIPEGSAESPDALPAAVASRKAILDEAQKLVGSRDVMGLLATARYLAGE